MYNMSISSSDSDTVRSAKKVSSMKPNSAYVPQDRFSRYLAALSSLALFKFKSALGSELPLDKVGLFSNASFRWLNEYLYAGYKNRMKDKTLPSLSHRETCNVNGPRFEALLHAHFVEKGQAGASIPKVAWRFVRTRVLVGSLLYFFGTLVSLAGPMFVLREMVRASQDRDVLNSALGNSTRNQNESDIIFMDEIVIFSYTGLLILIQVVSQFLIAWSSSLNLRTACRLRSACLAVSYKKLLRSSLRCSTSAQQSLTYFVPDSETLHELIRLGPLVLTGPTVLAIVSVFTWITLGAWAVIGIIVIILLYLCLVVAAYFTRRFASRAIEYSLRRMSLVEEFLRNVQLAKMTLWDRYFQDKIREVRRGELAEMQFGGFSEGCGLSLVHAIPIFTVSIISLISLVFEKPISFARYVPVLVLFLVNLKDCIRTSWLALSGISRGLAFLDKLKSVLILREAERFLDKPIDRSFAVIVRNGHFAWSNQMDTAGLSRDRTSRFYVDKLETINIELNPTNSLVTTLSEIDFYLPKGKVVGLFGDQDSGKTSFLLSLLGQLRRVTGTVAIDGTCSYLPHDPWLMDGTIKENVLFGEPFDSTRYYRAMRSSQLSNAISRLPELDDTEIAIANLTEGEKERLGLARVVYAQRDINLMDEPLAKLEPQDRTDVFERCVIQQLGGRTIVLASEQPELLSRCHLVYVMHRGRIVETGTHDHLVKTNPRYAKSIKNICERGSYRNWEESSRSPSRLTPSSPKDYVSSNASFESSDNNNEDLRPLYGRTTFDIPVLYGIDVNTSKTGLGVYLRYSGGKSICILLAFLSALYACTIASAPLFVVYVGQKTDQDTKISAGALATLVGFLIVCGAALTIAYNKTIFLAATKLHDYWIENLSAARISSFSAAAISVLLNVCSLNLQEVDSVLPRSVITVLVNVGISFFSLIILAVISPWLILPGFVFVVTSVMCSVFVRGAVLSLHELKVSSATFVLSYIGNTVQGRATIQAFSKENDFTKKYYKYFNENSTYDFMLYSTKLWLEFRLQLLSVLVLSAVIFMTELLDGSSNSLPRLSLAYICTLQLTQGMLHFLGSTNNVYASLLAVNSIDRYAESIPKEREGTARISDSWPTDGSLQFRNVALLESGEPPNTKPWNFSIPSGDDIAIVSSRTDITTALVSALLRFTELTSGEILIDNHSIANVPLDSLRRSIAFVPGNPLLFDGTIRHNLDPSRKMADQTLVRVLQRVRLWEKISRLPDKLVSDSRHLFPICERALIFLARALLNERTKIVAIEQPDVNLDDRDSVLETVLRDAFENYTVIRLSGRKVPSCHKYIILESEINDDCDSDRGSSTLSQLTTTTQVFSAVPVTVLTDNVN